MDPWLERISINPQVCGGKPCIKGTRIWVSLILDLLASGISEAELLNEYPGLVHDDILAAIAYGAEAARERVIPVPADTGSTVVSSSTPPVQPSTTQTRPRRRGRAGKLLLSP
jgi:uncharacterized protein (DUF433 family)